MDLNTILDLTWVSLLTFAICVIYAGILFYTKSAQSLLGRQNKKPLKDEKKYAEEAAKLLLIFGVASLINAGLMLVNIPAAIAEILVAAVPVMVKWKKMSDLYGPMN